MIMTRTALIAAAAAMLATMPALAQAAPAGRTVGYADLDLSRPSDVARLRARIAGALESVCGSYATSESWQEREIARCRAEARTQADAQLARHTSRTVQIAARR
jgi:UrcA family protein